MINLSGASYAPLLLMAFCAFALLVEGVIVCRRLLGRETSAPTLRANSSDIFLFGFIATLTILSALGVANLVNDFVGFPTEWSVFLPTICMQIFLVVAVLVYGRFSSEKKWGAGLFVRPKFADICAGIKFFFLALLTMLFATSLSRIVVEYVTGATPEPQMIVNVFVETQDTFAIILATISIIILAPISEELLYRGLLFRLFRDATGMVFPSFNSLTLRARAVIATVLSSMIFSYIHLNLYAAFPLFVMGLIFVCAYSRTSSIWTPITTHALFNALNLMLIYIKANENL